MNKVQIRDKFRAYHNGKKTFVRTRIDQLVIGDIIDLDIDVPFSGEPHLILEISEKNNCLEFIFQLPYGNVRYHSTGFDKTQFVYKIENT